MFGCRGIRLAEARVLRLALFGRLDTRSEQHAGAYEKIALGSMLKAGHLPRDGTRYNAADEVLECISDGSGTR